MPVFAPECRHTINRSITSPADTSIPSLSRFAATSSRGVLVRTIAVGLTTLAAAAGLLAWSAYSAPLAARFWVAAMDSGILVAAIAWRLGGRPEEPSPARTRPSYRLGHGLSIATHVTLGRGALISVLAGFLFMPRPTGSVAWLPAAIYTIAIIADRYDGILARRLGEVTALGRQLDVAVDAWGLVVAPLVAVRWGRLPAGYLLLSAAYYVFAAGLWARRRLGLPVFSGRLRPSRLARFFAGVQMTVCAAALFPVLPSWLTGGMATVAMVPTLGLFTRDWLVVIGRLPPTETAAPPAPPAARSDGGDDTRARPRTS